MTRFRRLRQARMIDWLLIALAATLAIAYFAPQQLPVTLYKVSLVSLFAVLGYRLDRSLFPYARPDKVTDLIAPMAGLRRAIIMAAVIIGGTLGV